MSEKIKDILMEHRGRKNAIAAKRISEAMGVSYGGHTVS